MFYLRWRAGERLRRIIGGLPRALCPASYSAEGFTNAFGAEPTGGWYAAPEALPFQTRDRKAELLAHHCRRRRFQLLHDRPHHLAQRRITFLLRRATAYYQVQ